MSRVRVLAVAVSVLIPALVVAALIARPVPGDPRQAPVAVIADPTVASGLVELLDAESGGVLDAAEEVSVDAARAAVEDGALVAALVVDLSVESDVLYVAGSTGSDVNTAVIDEIETLMTSFGRPVAVQDVHPAPVSERVPAAVVIGGLALGLVLALVRRWTEARATRAPRHLAERIGTDALLYGVVLGLAAVLGVVSGSPPVWIALGALLVVVSTTVTAAAVRALGYWGLGVAGALLVAPAWLLLRAPHELLLPSGWAELTPWLPHGAAIHVATRLAQFGDAATAGPWLVLGAWALVGVAALALVRRRPA